MNREILFRGKRLFICDWVEGTGIFNDGINTWISFNEPSKPIAYGLKHEIVYTETVGQFTGLNDENGKKIFEGDIISYIVPDGSYAIGVVKFGYYGCGGVCNVGFFIEWVLRYNSGFLRNDIGFWAKFREIEIIGNIHDNPELLEGGVK